MIEFRHVSKTYGQQKAVDDLNLQSGEGSFSVLIGTSGSGKSTTLKMINRLVEHDSGADPFRRGGDPQPAGAGVTTAHGVRDSVYWSVSPLDRRAEYCHRTAAAKVVTFTY